MTPDLSPANYPAEPDPVDLDRLVADAVADRVLAEHAKRERRDG